jgi:hypothetical protein
MSYTFLQAQGEVSSVDSYSDIPRSVLLKLKSTQDKSCCNDNETECCPSSPSGMMSAPLMGSPGEEQLMLFAEDSHAKTSVPQEEEPALEESVLDYGKNMPELLERYGLSLSLRKTPRFCGLVALTLSSETCPSWGMMQSGACWELGTSARPIKEIGCGSWPTPTRRDYKGTNSPEGLTRKDGKSRMDQLPNAVAYGGTKTHQKWGTPRCFMHKDALTDRGKGNLGEQVNEREGVKKTGQLNPPWVEWLMGWPIGWTDLKPLETDRFQQWQQQHGTF